MLRPVLYLCSLIPRPLPRFYLAAMEKNHGCEIKYGRRPGDEASIYVGVISTSCCHMVASVLTLEAWNGLCTAGGT